MARRKIREYDAKQLLVEHLPQYGYVVEWKGILVTPETDFTTLPQHYPWLLTIPLVAKPDQLFGQRGKLGLIAVNCTFDKAKEFIQIQRNKETVIGKATDRLTHFLIEPFIHHEKEYYLAINSNSRDGNNILFSYKGGIEVEENWKWVTTLFLTTGNIATEENVQSLFEMRENISNQIILSEEKKVLEKFIIALYKTFIDLNFTYLELNPFTINAQNQIHILDTVAQVDDGASFQHRPEWKNLSFPKVFGQKSYPEEESIANIDKESGASLKLTILNPSGRIWNILSGGGASIIYLDTIANLGKENEIANYGEYSGNPTTEESYQYAKIILDLMTREHHPEGKILIIGGAIANFTDVEKTFTGIIRALREYQEKLHQGKVSIFVRRGGPNYERGLKLMKQAGKEIDIPLLVQGPETPMVEIVGKAMEKIENELQM